MATIAEMQEQIGNPPEPLRWMDVAGQRIFPAYGPSGGVCSYAVGVLLDSRVDMRSVRFSDMGRFGMHESDGAKWYVVEFDVFRPEEWHEVLKTGIEAMGVQ